MDGAAFGAGPFADGQRQRFAVATAFATGLAAGKPAIHQHHHATGQRGLVFDLPAHLVKPDVRNGPRQLVVRHHAAHVEVFHADQREPSGQCRGGLVRPVFADVRDASVQLRQPRGRLAPVVGAFHLAGMLALAPLERPQVPLERLGSGELFPGAKGGGDAHAKIDPNSGTRIDGWQLGKRDQDRNREEPASRFAAEGGASRFHRRTAGLPAS